MRRNYHVVIIASLVVFLNSLSMSQGSPIPLYKRPDVLVERRVADLLSRMTTEEKFWQLFMIPGDLSDGEEKYVHGIFGLNVRDRGETKHAAEQMLEYADRGVAGKTAAKINEIQKYFVENTRLGIPIIPFDEALHGMLREGATTFPQSIGLAATWDVELMKKVAGAIAKETRTRGLRDVLSPVVNIARDVRWGRVEETYGEDPFLTSAMGVAFVKSFEDQGVITTPKHFAANVGDGGRDSYPIHFSKQLLNEIYLPAFKACVQQGGAGSVMTAYNSIDGIPCSSNPWLLRSTLKEGWGFGGFVISDAGAVGGILDLHHTVKDREESAKSAIEGGLDVIFQTDYDHHIPLLKAFQDGMIGAAAVDSAVTRVLRAKFRLGLFENPYVDPREAERWNGNPDHRQIALQAARESIVLLKNDQHTLPFKREIRSLAVIGSDAAEARLGGYSGPGINNVSILDGIMRKVVDPKTVHYARGCSRVDTTVVTIPARFLSTPEGKPGLEGEFFNNTDFTGQPALVRTDRQIDFRWTLFSPDPLINQDWYAVRWTGKIKASRTGLFKIGIEGDDGYRLFIDGRLLVDNWRKESFRLMTVPVQWVKDREYAIRLEFYENVGNVKLRLVWDAGVPDPERKIDEAVRLAQSCDASIIVAGIEEGEFRDRAILSLPGHQEEMIRRVSDLGKPVVVVLVGGSAITMAHWLNRVPAILDVWYPGEVGGTAVAEVLFGDYNPAGRLPITFPQSEGQLPLYYNHKPTGRGDDYDDLTGKPLFPFGHGLSYTSFEYEGLEVSPAEIAPGGKAVVKCRVSNTGKLAGDEVVQLYIRGIISTISRPVLELKGFRRLWLRPGESQEVSFELSHDELSVLNEDLLPVVQPGEFKVMVGSSCRDIRQRGVLTILRRP